MMDKLIKQRKIIKEICDSLYLTGLNGGKNKTEYFPKPHQSYFHVDKILEFYHQQKKEAIIKILMQYTLPKDQLGFETVEQIAQKILDILENYKPD